MQSKYIFLLLLLLAVSSIGCTKLVKIDPPVSSITTSQVFNDSADANSAILGIYTQMINTANGTAYFGNGAITFYCGSSADEHAPFYSGNDQFYPNLLTANNIYVNVFLWLPAYSYIFQANACIEGLEASKGSISPAAKQQFIGEARFIRAFCYFYLVNLFGDVPIVTSATNWDETRTASRSSREQVYEQIIADLKEAQSLLVEDYSYSNGEHIRANKAAATALLSRVYLYTGKWNDAAEQASAVINNTNYSLVTDPGNVFAANSSEAILQWGLNYSLSFTYNATVEGYNNLPPDPSNPPSYYLSKYLLNSFEPGDRRYQAWVDSSESGGTTYYYSHKYKVGVGQAANTPATEYYMALRLAEQYLIRAEAQAQSNNLTDAINDLNIIRNRAGLTELPLTLNQEEVLAAVAQERKIELFSEWGHRWLDLKRTGQVDSVMSIVTPTKRLGIRWNTNQQLYPIPVTELQTDPNLTQNEGY